MKLLLIEDDKDMQEAIKDVLCPKYQLDLASSLEEAEALIHKSQYHLILLDIQLPDGNGLDYLKQLRAFTSIPLIFISVMSDDHLIANGLDFGADDYITKPFSIQVLLSRINSVLRRYYGHQQTALKIGDLEIDLEKERIFKNSKEITLTTIEQKIFFLLVHANGRTLTRHFLFEQIWDSKDQDVEDNTLTVHIRRLKNKIGEGYIETKRNVGYCFVGENNV